MDSRRFPLCCDRPDHTRGRPAAAAGQEYSVLGKRPAAASFPVVTAFTQSLIDEIKTAPESVQREVADFLAFLKARERSEGQESLLPLAHRSWAADWDNPEEDAAWRDL